MVNIDIEAVVSSLEYVRCVCATSECRDCVFSVNRACVFLNNVDIDNNPSTDWDIDAIRLAFNKAIKEEGGNDLCR